MPTISPSIYQELLIGTLTIPLVSVSLLSVGGTKLNKMKTHKVVDVIDGTDDALYYDTEEECYEWKRQQGFGYKVVTLSKEERVLANER